MFRFLSTTEAQRRQKAATKLEIDGIFQTKEILGEKTRNSALVSQSGQGPQPN
jgi:hypothetical protein